MKRVAEEKKDDFSDNSLPINSPAKNRKESTKSVPWNASAKVDIPSEQRFRSATVAYP